MRCTWVPWLPDLLVEITIARGNGTYQEVMKKYKKVSLLILDEWLLYSLKESEARDLLELIEARNKVSSTIFCSQFDVNEWHTSLYDLTMADAICDQIVYNSHTVKIEGDSMRKKATIAEYALETCMVAAPFVTVAMHHSNGTPAPRSSEWLHSSGSVRIDEVYHLLYPDRYMIHTTSMLFV